MSKKNITINFFASGIVFIVSFAISFFLSPFLISTLGEEAYGFYNLGTQFISYAGIVTLAINSMAGKFVTISLYRDEIRAKRYFCSTFYGNIIVSIVLAIVSAFFILNIQRFLNISDSILSDVKVLWTLMFSSFIIGLIFNVFSIAAFSKNKIYLDSVSKLVQSIIKAFTLVFLYSVFVPRIWYLGFSSVLCAFFAAGFGIIITKKLLPTFNLKKQFFSWRSMGEQISAGAWNSLMQFAGVLSNGLDLLLTNIFVNPVSMGIMAVAKTIPTYLTQINYTFVSAFIPQITISYAEGNKREMIGHIVFCHKIMTVVMCIPTVLIAVYGKEFFFLWMPTINTYGVQIVSLVTLSIYFILGPISALNEVISITNKHRMVAITFTGAGLLNIAIVAWLLHVIKNAGYSELWGIDIEIIKMAIIAGISAVIELLRNLIFTPLYAAKCINEKWTCFYPMILKGLLISGICIVISGIIRRVFCPNTWILLIVCFVISTLCMFVVSIALLFNRKELHGLWGYVKEKINNRQ